FLWAGAYLGAAAWNASRPAAVLPWDPVWTFPFVSAFVVPYLSAYLLPFAVPFVLRDRAKYRRFAAVAAATIAFSAACFILWPLTIARPELGVSSALDRLLGALYAADRPTNLFPSLHVSLSFLFAAAVGDARPRLRPWMTAWAALIAVSTLFTRQHYLIDVIGGVLVAWIAWRIYLGKRR
ncbi:MAG TPA: phosphatase PAP2 family protein, partial [Candidatus Baltobacteraceae bacterium]|nr:phosphatase PAP2 family protein [Candidatus Baltobacteraceae bacterium]